MLFFVMTMKNGYLDFDKILLQRVTIGFDALILPDLKVATDFVSVLRVLFPDFYFRIFPFSE